MNGRLLAKEGKGTERKGKGSSQLDYRVKDGKGGGKANVRGEDRATRLKEKESIIGED